MKVAVIIKHHDEEEYIVDINTSIMAGLHKYLDTYYHGNERIFLNELPHSCKEYTLDTVLIIESDKSLSAHKVVQKKIDGWISSANKIRSEHLFDMRIVNMSRHVIREFLRVSDMGNALLDAEKRNNDKEREIRNLRARIEQVHEMLKESQDREDIMSNRLEILTGFLPPESVEKFIQMTKK